MEQRKDETPRERTEHTEHTCLHHLFEAQARRTPDALALVDTDTRMSYRELDGLTDLLAARLRASGVGPDVPVGIHMERCAGYVVAMLAALKAGGAFLPMELAYPKAMLEGITAEASPPVILTKKRYKDNLPTGPKAIELDTDREESPGASGNATPPDSGPDDLAFIAYSSGTTGKPKGIANPHRAAVGSYLWRFGLDAPGKGDRVGCNVFFIWEALRPLLRGAASVVIPDDAIYDPDALVRFLREHEVTETLMTPSLLAAVLNHSEERLARTLPDLNTLWLNGEVVTKSLVDRASSALPHTRLLNVYSASETHEVAAGDLRELRRVPGSTYCPVGAPFDAEHVHILDEEMRPVPDGEEGELYVGGDWLAREYIGLPEKTAESFLEDPFERETKVYRTGDRARLLADGNLEVLGRCDFMVKVRGYSIELGAVETAIEENLPVRGCCVVPDGEEGEDKRLIAYLVPSDGELPEVDRRTGRSPDIRRVLKDALPHYAIPAAFVAMDSLPLQETTGKVDRTELPPPPRRGAAGVPSVEGMELPADASASEREASIARIFEAVLRLDEGDVDREDDFFDVGGHSLAAAETLSLIEDVFGVRLPVGVLLEAPTAAKLAERLADQEENGARDRASHVPRADAVLEEDISPAGEASSATLGEARKVFLTGATGFLGSFLLDEILHRTEAEVHCLVRRREGASLLSSLRESLRGRGLWDPEYEERIFPVPGDLGEPLLGMDRKAFDALADEMDLVMHAGAAVNLVYPYPALKEVNVDGTREALRLCCRGRAKPLHHVSTNGVFPPGAGLCLEDAEIDSLLDGLEDGYGRSKWAAEKLVRQASERGLPTAVYRPGNISGHTGSGVSNQRDFLTAVISASISLGCAPDLDVWRMEMTPVDFVAAAICEIATSSPTSETFHLANPSPPSAAHVFDQLEDLGHPMERLDPETWRKRLLDSEGHDLAKAMLGDGSLFAHGLTDGNTYDDRNTRAALAGTSLSRPEIDRDLLETYAGYLTDDADDLARAGTSGER